MAVFNLKCTKTMARKAKEETKVVKLYGLQFATIQVPIVGVTPLIMHRFDEKSKRQMDEAAEAEKGLKQGGKKKNIADPKEDYENSIYYLSNGKDYGFPALAFKAAMVSAAYRAYGKKMTIANSAFQVLADDSETGLVKINGTPRMREDMVRIGGITKVASPRYRAEFPTWSAIITIKYLADIVSESELVGYLNAAGFSVGIGEWRPEKSGDKGMFEVLASE